MWASFGLKRDRTLTLAPPPLRGEEARYMIIIPDRGQSIAAKHCRHRHLAYQCVFRQIPARAMRFGLIFLAL